MSTTIVHVPPDVSAWIDSQKLPGETRSQAASRLLKGVASTAEPPPERPRSLTGPELEAARKALAEKAARQRALEAPDAPPAHVGHAAPRMPRGEVPANRRSRGTGVFKLPVVGTENHPCGNLDPNRPPNSDPAAFAGTCLALSKRTGSPRGCTFSPDRAAPLNRDTGVGCSDFRPRFAG